MAAKKLAYYLIPLIVLVLLLLWQFGPSGLFEGMKKAVKGIMAIMPEIGAEEVEAEEIPLNKGQLESIASLEQTIKAMLGSSKTNCFKQYIRLPSLEENNVRIVFQHSGDKTIMVVKKGDGSSLMHKITEIPGMKPCVIAGESAGGREISENFYFTFLQPGRGEVEGAVYSPKAGVEIAYDTRGSNENRINFGTGFKDFEDNGWLFTPDGKHICFFPTVDGDNDEDGLNDDYLKVYADYFENKRCD